ncbi:hypothetical protein M011DRAFT_63519 [Sporormia fimetaria CBS 119925]|uniref:Uncharacterized protein n=1 Tax=Sporormia fimetaria CBS 119925 TaxID=1340428 RepID=A0A6A6V928_9PLEO|nr:hypothetical protein M011DRAFT_63519 [Sporormia fimetaria CBS 119925]
MCWRNRLPVGGLIWICSRRVSNFLVCRVSSGTTCISRIQMEVGFQGCGCHPACAKGPRVDKGSPLCQQQCRIRHPSGSQIERKFMARRPVRIGKMLYVVRIARGWTAVAENLLKLRLRQPVICGALKARDSPATSKWAVASAPLQRHRLSPRQQLGKEEALQPNAISICLCKDLWPDAQQTRGRSK